MVTWDGTPTTIGTEKTGVGTTELFFNEIDGQEVETQIEVIINNESGSVTDGLVVSLYLTMHATADFDTFSYEQWTLIPDGVGDEKFSFKIGSVWEWQLGVVSAGTTDTYTVNGNFTKRTV